MSVRLGVSPIGWSNDDLPELGGDILLDTCLAEAREADFEGIELGHKFPRERAFERSASRIRFSSSGELQTFGSATLPRCERPKKNLDNVGELEVRIHSPPGESCVRTCMPAGG